MKPLRGLFGPSWTPPGSPGGGPTGIGILLVLLIWCTSITTATMPTRTAANVIKKRTLDNTDTDPLLIEEDQCANFRTDLGADLKRLLDLPWMEMSGKTDMCLCSSTVSNFVEHTKNKQIEIANSIVGREKVKQALQNLISRHHPQICGALPAHAVRTCNSDRHSSDACDFSCQSPFQKGGQRNNQRCVLPASPSAHVKKRSLQDQIAIMHTSACQPHEQVCARNGHGYSSATPPSSRIRSTALGGIGASFECIDVSRDLFNCGGCAAGALGLEQEVVGVDCSDLAGVSDVQCVVGRCKVTKCGWGWKVSARGDGCVRNKS